MCIICPVLTTILWLKYCCTIYETMADGTLPRDMKWKLLMSGVGSLACDENFELTWPNNTRLLTLSVYAP